MTMTTTTPMTMMMIATTNASTNASVNGTEGGSTGPLVSLTVPLLMFCAGALGNVLALAVLWRSRGENARSVFYRLVAALAVTDLCGTLALSPVTLLVYSNNRQWVGGQPLCHYYAFMMLVAGLSTLLLVLCMALERCLAILAPYFYELHVGPGRVKVLLLAVGGTAVLIACLPLFGVGRNVRHYPGTWCFFDFHSPRTLDKAFSIVYAGIGLAVIAATALCNVAVMAVLLRMRRVALNIGKSRKGRTLTNMTSEMQMIFFLAGIILVFGACYCPLMVRVIINVVSSGPRDLGADLMAIRLASLNQILDPWVYLLLRPRLVTLLYSACRSVSPLPRMTSLRAGVSEMFSTNSPKNSPVTGTPRALSARIRAARGGLGSDASLPVRKDSPEENGLEECLPLTVQGSDASLLPREDSPVDQGLEKRLLLSEGYTEERNGHAGSFVAKCEVNETGSESRDCSSRGCMLDSPDMAQGSPGTTTHGGFSYCGDLSDTSDIPRDVPSCEFVLDTGVVPKHCPGGDCVMDSADVAKDSAHSSSLSEGRDVPLDPNSVCLLDTRDLPERSTDVVRMTDSVEMPLGSSNSCRTSDTRDVPRNSPNDNCLSDRGGGPLDSPDSACVPSKGSSRSSLLVRQQAFDVDQTADNGDPGSAVSLHHTDLAETAARATETVSPNSKQTKSSMTKDVRNNGDAIKDLNSKPRASDLQTSKGYLQNVDSSSMQTTDDIQSNSKSTKHSDSNHTNAPRRTLPKTALTDSGSKPLMTTSASWPVICRHGNVRVVKMDGVGLSNNGGLGWQKRHSHVETTCPQCNLTAADGSFV